MKIEYKWDIEQKQNPQNVSIYAKEIIEYLWEREKEFRICEYLEKQEDMDSVMR